MPKYKIRKDIRMRRWNVEHIDEGDYEVVCFQTWPEAIQFVSDRIYFDRLNEYQPNFSRGISYGWAA